MRFILVFLFSTLLASCGSLDFGKDEQEPRLSGKRVDVLVKGSQLKPNVLAMLVKLELPPAAINENWPQAYGNAAHLVEHVMIPKQVRRAWTRRVGDVRGQALNPPVIHAGRLFTVDSENIVTALSAQSGKVLWRKELPVRDEEFEFFPGGLVVEGDRLFVTTAIGEVFALSASSGEIVWRSDVGAPVRAAPTLAGQVLLVVSHNNRTFGLDVRQGNLLWTHSGIVESLSLIHGAAPAAAGETVVVPYSSGDIYALKLEDGQYLWHAALGGFAMGGSVEGLQSVSGAPVIKDNVVYAATVSGFLAAFDLKSGQRLWRAPVPGGGTPWVAGNILFVLTEDGRLVAVNRESGQIRWVTNLNSYVEDEDIRYWTGPILAGGRLIVASSDGVAMSLHPDDGRKLQVVQLLGDEGVSVPPVVAGGGMFFLTDDGDVVSFK
jgi:outer membrane protein assembly factor BamB